jgi:hypothetical protein
MTSFLFWNVMRKDLRTLIAEAVIEHDVDILLLAESGVSDADMTAALEATSGREYTALSQEADKIRLFTRLPITMWTRRQTDALSARMAIWSVTVGKHPGILLATTHFVSKNNALPGEQALLASELAKEINRVEEFVGHERTLVVGDLNMNPYELGVTGATALHAVMTTTIAERRHRVVQGRRYRFFYNPMWGFFGDRTEGQVLLRPALMHLLHDLAILDTIEEECLLTQPAGLPRETVGSDHLPLAFRLTLD